MPTITMPLNRVPSPLVRGPMTSFQVLPSSPSAHTPSVWVMYSRAGETWLSRATETAGFVEAVDRDRVVKVLQAAERVLGLGGEFRYVHQLEDPDERVAMLEFATVVGGKQVEGIDKLTFDDSGMITELKVMIRPASALQLVGAKMAEEFPKVGLRRPD